MAKNGGGGIEVTTTTTGKDIMKVEKNMKKERRSKSKDMRRIKVTYKGGSVPMVCLKRTEALQGVIKR